MFFNNRIRDRFYGNSKYLRFYGIKKEKELSWQELRKLAKEKEIPNYTKMNREELEKAIYGTE